MLARPWQTLPQVIRPPMSPWLTISFDSPPLQSWPPKTKSLPILWETTTLRPPPALRMAPLVTTSLREWLRGLTLQMTPLPQAPFPIMKLWALQ